MSKIKVKLSERISIIKFLNEFRGGFVEQSVIAEDAKKFFITNKDWDKAEKQEIESPTPEDPNGKTWVWKNDFEEEFEIGDVTKDYIISKLKEIDEKKEVGINDTAIASLYNKLNK